MLLVDNTGNAHTPPITSLFGTEIREAIMATGTLPAELDDICTLRRVVVDGLVRWILDPA